MSQKIVSVEEALKVIQRLRDRPAERVASSELVFTGLSLREIDLSGLNLMGADFTDADLSGANLTKSNLFKATLVRTNLVSTILVDTELTGANLTEANMEETNAERAGLGMAILHKARMFNIALAGATLTKADLTGADLRHGKLVRARMREVQLTETDCTGADFRGADMTYTKVDRAIMNNADLRNTRLSQITGYRTAEWYGADIRNINFCGAYQLRRFVIDENYLKEFRDVSKTNYIIYRIWSITSDCGRSLHRWCLWILGIVLLFSFLFAFTDVDYGKYDNWVAPFYYSVVTITTLGYGDIIPASPIARMIAMSEVFIGYIMLGGLLAIFTNKMARRGE